MRAAASTIALLLMAAGPAAPEIHLHGGENFGFDALHAEGCPRDSITFRQTCLKDSAGKHAQESGLLKIGGEAKMGLVYDGSGIRPVSGVSITISFGSETEDGLRLGGMTTVENE